MGKNPKDHSTKVTSGMIDRPSYRVESLNSRLGTHEIRAQGDALGPHERIMIHRQKMAAISSAAAYAAAVGFAAIGTLLIVLAPETRTVAANIAATALLVVAAGLAGFTRLRAKFPGAEVQADTKSIGHHPRLANLPPCLVGMEACVGAHHLARKLTAFGHDARLMPAKYVDPMREGKKMTSTTPTRLRRRCSVQR